MTPHVNLFGFLRIIGALLVVIHHSYGLITGTRNTDPLLRITGILDFGNLGLIIFFAISGYLITKSRLKSSWYDFTRKRFLRIFPGLIVCILATSLLLAPWFYYNTIDAFYSDYSVWTYINSNIWLLFTTQKLEISGIFYNNIFKNVMNGSLWSLPLELSLYTLLLFTVKEKIKLQIVFFIVLFFIVHTAVYHNWNTILINNFFAITGYFERLPKPELLKYGLVFLIGSRLSLCNQDKYKLKITIALLALPLAILSDNFFLIETTIYASIALAVVFIGNLKPQAYINKLQQFGDPSYGIYIYSFPVQQAIIALHLGNQVPLSPPILFAYSFVISIVLGYGSWHLVEKKFLQRNTS